MTDPTSRALTLLGLLESRPVWAGQELADRLGVTVRTVRRDIDRLRGLGYTVDADTGAAGGYSLGRGQVLPPLLLDEDEAVAVTLALSTAALDGDGMQAEAALRALAKLDDVTPGPLRRRLQGLREAITVTPAATGLDARVLLPCAEAVRRTVRLTFTYRDRSGTVTSRTVEPHRLLARGRTWRLLAHDLDREDWRTFRLDRLSDPRVSAWRFTPRSDVDAALARLDAPMPPEAWRHQAHVHIHAPLAEVAASMPTVAGQLHAVDDRTTGFSAGADDPSSAAWWLARIGHDFTVIGDEAVRTAVAALGQRLAAAV